MIGYYNYSVILTYIGLASAVYGMVQAMSYNPRVAILCLMVCGLCDAFDGAIARTCKRTEDEKSFGMQIDSLCDLLWCISGDHRLRTRHSFHRRLSVYVLLHPGDGDSSGLF